MKIVAGAGKKVLQYKYMARFKLSLSKWEKVILWVLGALAVLVMIAFMGWKIWLSTWKTYTNSNFGFSFRYPGTWHLVADLPVTKQQIDKSRQVEFYVDLKEKLPNSPTDPLRSQGDVQVDIRKDNSIITAHKLQKDFSKLETKRFGSVTGLVDSGVGRTSYSNGLFVFSDDLYIESGGVWYYINSLSISNKVGFFSKIKAEFYSWIGSSIINSFIFAK
jgi:hypothetical protein